MTKKFLLYPGRFIRTNYASKQWQVSTSCALCRRETCAAVWHQLDTEATVCMTCLPDPFADDGDAGRNVARSLDA